MTVSPTSDGPAAAPSGAPAPDGPLAAYRPIPGVRDEMVDADGRVRPHWQPLAAGLDALGTDGLDRLGQSVRRLLEDSGVAFNVYADPDDRRQAWNLDAVPVLLSPEDWAVIEAGVTQRGRLIEAVLRDLYGAQTLVTDSQLPAGAVFGNPNFLLPAIGWDQRPDCLLHVYACDLARRADGTWVVLADQTEVPTGNGWCLVNRVSMSQVHGDRFTGSGVRRLAGYYARFQAGMHALAAGRGRIVLLTPGPADPSYFSHAYLARYMGFMLVEAGDLTVRDGRVFVKTLEGLQRVDVILRKLPGRSLDPLYLPGGQQIGTPALVHAARDGTVRLANAAGTGVVQNRMLAPFAPALARRLLGEDLLLPDIETVWLGDADGRARYLAAPEDWRIDRATARHDPDGRAVARTAIDALSQADRGELLAQDGDAHVAIRPIALATTPSVEGGRVVPVPWALRVFLFAGPDGFQVMPGGLGRLSDRAETPVLPGGRGSKDVWVQGAPGEARAPSILSAHLRDAHHRRTGRELLSRVADNLFWLGRYGERTDMSLRILRVALSRVLDEARQDLDAYVLNGLLGLRLDLPLLAPDTGPAALRLWLDRAAARLMLDADETLGLRSSLDGLHRTATLSRAYLSQDAWRSLTALRTDRRWRTMREPVLTLQTAQTVDAGLRCLSAFGGAMAENMMRSFGWRFFELGRRLERGIEIARAAAALAGLAGPSEAPALRTLLELCDSYVSYRARYLITPAATPTIDLLILDETNPRALAFQFARLDTILGQIHQDAAYRTRDHRLVLSHLTALRLADPEDLAGAADGVARPALLDLTGRVQRDLLEVSNQISRSFFTHAERPVRS